MKRSTRKNMFGVTLGVLIVGMSIGSLTHAHNGMQGIPPAQHMQADRAHSDVALNSDEVAAYISSNFDVKESEIKKAIKNKVALHDVGHAAMLSKLSGKPFRDVLAMKTDRNNWQEIAASLGVTREEIQKQLDEMAIEHIAARGDVDENTARSLMQEGYDPHDIEAAGIIAKASGKDIRTVLGSKKINNRWEDVADEFGVDQTLVQPAWPSGTPGHEHPMEK